jgi:hypothetical protein
MGRQESRNQAYDRGGESPRLVGLHRLMTTRAGRCLC